MKILAIESSCDETAASVVEGHGDSVQVLSNVVASQIDIHQKYGGVVPEIAAREHVLNILPVIHEALENAKISNSSIDSIAVTTGPGLITSLMIGIETAKTLAYAWNKPIVAVNHIAGHIYANWIDSNDKRPLLIKERVGVRFPAIILTVSGGHNLLVVMKNHLNYKIIGDTRDDAAGEAFDKAAKMLNLGYPGGPAIAACAAKITNYELRITNKISLPRPMMYSKDFDFSFSGLKTGLLYALKKDADWKNKIPEYAADFQQAVIDVLIHKTIKATQNYKAKTVLLAGGVSANIELRTQLAQAVANKLPDANFSLPDLKYTTDNAAMIGSAGYFMTRAKKFTPWQKLKVDPNLELK